MSRSIKVDQLNEAISAVPGAIVLVSPAQPASNITAGASYIQFFPDSSGSSSFTLAVAGDYEMTFAATIWGQGGATTAQVKFVIDEGLSTEKTIGDSDPHWRIRAHNDSIHEMAITDKITLAAGARTLKGYFKTIAGGNTATIIGSGTALCQSCRVTFQLLGGSGVGGLIITEKTLAADFALDTTAGLDSNFNPTSPTWADVDNGGGDNLIATINTFANEEVLINISGYARPKTGSDVLFFHWVGLKIDGVIERIYHPCSNLGNVNSHRYSYRKQFTAGSHTITVIGVSYTGQLARLLGNTGGPNDGFRLMIVQYRGGQMPIKKDSVLVAATQQSLNFTGPGVQLVNSGGEVNIALAGISPARIVDPSFFVSNTDPKVSHTDGRFTDGFKFHCLRPCRILGVRYYSGNDAGYTYRLSLWRNSDSTRVKDVSVSSPSALGVYEAYFSTPYEVTVAEVLTYFTVSIYWGRAFFYQVDAPTLLDFPRVIGRAYVANSRPNLYNTGGDLLPTTVWSGGYYPVEPIIDTVPDVGATTYPENIPILEYSTASAINVKAAPGCSTQLRAVLNDGQEYTYSATLTIDLTVSGRGGLDTGSEASDTWYYCYLVPSITTGQLAVLCSATAPSTGPTGYPIFKYIGAFRNNNAAAIKKFEQINDKFYYHAFADYVVYSGSNIDPDVAYVAVDISGFVPATVGTVGWLDTASLSAENPAGYWNVKWSLDGTDVLLQHLIMGDRNELFIDPFEGEIQVPTNRTIYRWRLRTTGSAQMSAHHYGPHYWTDAWLSKNTRMPLLSTALLSNPEDVPPNNPSVYDDEFSGNSIDSKWTWYVAGLPSASGESATVSNGKLNIVATSAADSFTNTHCICQNLPAQNFEAVAKWRANRRENYQGVGLVLLESSTNKARMNLFGHHSALGGANASWVVNWEGSWSDMWVSDGFPNDVMISKMNYNISTKVVTYYFSYDGYMWNLLYTAAAITTYTPNKFGLVFKGNAGSSSLVASIDWFRVTLL